MHDRIVIESVDDDMAAILRLKTPAERLSIGFGMWRSARSMLTSMLRDRFPEWSDDEVNSEVASRMSRGT